MPGIWQTSSSTHIISDAAAVRIQLSDDAGASSGISGPFFGSYRFNIVLFHHKLPSHCLASSMV